jgi:tight adherence protein B
MTGKVILAIGIVAILVVAFRIYMFSRISRRQAMFDTQLVDALELAARSLRAGHPLLGAFQLLADEMAPPVSTIFADVCQQHGLGADLEQVLREAGDRSGSGDMKIFATSVAMQLRTGGNLADLMERLAEVMRERMRLHRRVRILTAQTQVSKRVLMALPFVVFIVFNLINPKYMSVFYYERAGTYMLAVSIVMLAIGSWIMNRMARLKY